MPNKQALVKTFSFRITKIHFKGIITASIPQRPKNVNEQMRHDKERKRMLDDTIALIEIFPLINSGVTFFISV